MKFNSDCTLNTGVNYTLIEKNKEQKENMNYELISVGVGAASGIVTTYVKMQSEIVKIKSRLYSLEKQETKVQQTLEVLLEGVNEIKILLAKKGIE
mgnify:CR=1 FL=1|jgi:hypothetical protein